MNPEIPEVEPDIPRNAISVYNEDNAEDFPVLKAFQQYIDAEQEKARKRILSMAIFFGLFTMLVIAIFVALLMHVSQRNQQLNDRLVEFAMRDRFQQPAAATSAPVVVQPPQDSSAILALTAKMDEMQKRLAESQAKAEREAKEAAERAEKAAIEAAKPKGPTKEELEIQKLKELLKAREQAAAEVAREEKARLKAEKEAKKQAEIEAYRRKHYPELYRAKPKPKRVVVEEEEELDDEVDDAHGAKVDALLQELDDNEAISYFDDEEENETPMVKSPSRVKPAARKKAEKNYSIPVDVKGSSNRTWNIPEE